MGCKNSLYRIVLGLMLLTTFTACLDELDIETLNQDEQSAALVVEAILTDEMITQKVYLSRSSLRLDLETDTVYNPFIPLGIRPKDSVDMEGGANVRLLGDNGTEHTFTEGDEGVYLSNQQFALEMGVDYTLEVTTSNGLEYESDPLSIKGKSQLTNVYAEKAFNQNGEEGIAIYVDSEPQQGNPRFYRYTYAETYKIVAPLWDDQQFVLTDYDPCALPVPTYNLEIVPREVQNKVCYNTVSSSTIDQLSTAGNSEDKVSRHMIRFIGKDNFIISHRYSILVQQQVQSADAYSFYGTLKSFSQSDNVFSQVQPGAIYANVHRKDGSVENVLGYMEAVGVSDQRLFFNYEDFFPDEELPPYAFGFSCDLFTSNESHVSYCSPGPQGDGCPPSIIEQVDQGLVTYYAEYDNDLVPTASCPGPYVFVSQICGDCTTLGSNVEPEFWME
jgi:Domain of unknown function (DUF4249)